MKSEQSTCQDKIRLPRSTRFDPISASDLGFSSAGDNKTILAEGARHRAAPAHLEQLGKGRDGISWWTLFDCGSKEEWLQDSCHCAPRLCAGMGSPAGHFSQYLIVVLRRNGCRIPLSAPRLCAGLGEHFSPDPLPLLSLGCHSEGRKMDLFWRAEVRWVWQCPHTIHGISAEHSQPKAEPRAVPSCS